MSSGAGHKHSKPADAENTLRRYLVMPQIKKRLADLMAGKIKIDETHDLPFLGGTAGQGSNWELAFDRHLPRTIPLVNHNTGKVDAVDPRQFLMWHEGLERALMDFIGLPYLRAHVFATMLEHQKLREAGYDPAEYEKKLEPMIKADESEKIKSPPPGLDKRPYTQDHDPSDNAKAVRRKLHIAA